MAKMRSENVNHAKSSREYFDTKGAADKDLTSFVNDRNVSDADFRQMIAARQKAERNVPEAEAKLDNTSKETGYDRPYFALTGDPEAIDRLSRSPTSDEEGNMRYRKGGMVKKKAKKMAGGGVVRGTGCATKGKGKMRMF